MPDMLPRRKTRSVAFVLNGKGCTEMPYIVNIDHPCKIGRIHWADARNKNCQPQYKLPRDGYWSDPVATRREAEALAQWERVEPKYCRTCFETV